MKKLQSKAFILGAEQILSRDQMRNVTGGTFPKQCTTCTANGTSGIACITKGISCVCSVGGLPC